MGTAPSQRQAHDQRQVLLRRSPSLPPLRVPPPCADPPSLPGSPAPQVHRARDRRSGALVALKHSYLPEGGELPRHVARELAALRGARHPRLVSLLDFRQQVGAGTRAVGCAAAGVPGFPALQANPTKIQK